MGSGNSTGINFLSPGATAGVLVGLILFLSLGVAVALSMVCLVRHRKAKSENSSTLWVSTREGISLGIIIILYYYVAYSN